MRSYALALAITTLVPLLGACKSAERDYAIRVRWTLNGMIPDRALCDELGIAGARLEVRRTGDQDGRTLEADCSDTVIDDYGDEWGGFETSYAFEWDVRYVYTLSLVDAAGVSVLERDVTATLEVPYEEFDMAELPNLDYLQPLGDAAALHAEWSVGMGGAASLAEACANERIETVSLVAVSYLNENFVNPVEIARAPCADGQFTSPGKILATGVYLFRYEALSAQQSTVYTGDPIEADVDLGRDVALPRQAFPPPR